MEEKVTVSMLLELYGNLLTEKQNDMLDDYFNQDLSLSEIAENEGITRQAVRDILKKGEKKLFEYEEKLGVMKKNNIHKEKIADILSEIEKIEEKYTDEELANVLEDVKTRLNCLV